MLHLPAGLMLLHSGNINQGTELSLLSLILFSLRKTQPSKQISSSSNFDLFYPLNYLILNRKPHLEHIKYEIIDNYRHLLFSNWFKCLGQKTNLKSQYKLSLIPINTKYSLNVLSLNKPISTPQFVCCKMQIKLQKQFFSL